MDVAEVFHGKRAVGLVEEGSGDEGSLVLLISWLDKIGFGGRVIFLHEERHTLTFARRGQDWTA